MARRSAEADPTDRSCSGRRPSDQFLAGLQSATRVTFVTHVNPDPDGLGAMLGLAHLVESKLGKPTRLTCDGLISRAENRAFVEALELDLVSVDEIDGTDEAVVMVDSQPNTGRHSFDPSLQLYAVIDHHDTSGDTAGVPFVDVRASVGATCSVVARYLMEQEVTIPPRVATALLYGIETELMGYPRDAGPLDDGALCFLYPLADKDIIARVRNARLPHEYFEGFLQAMQNSFIYDRLIISWVNDLPSPELAAEIADHMIRFEEVDWAVCAGVCGDKIILSLRSSLRTAKGGELLQKVVGNRGKAGGHDRRAGGCIRLTNPTLSAIEEVRSDLRRRLLKALDIEEIRGQRLVKLGEMLHNLQT